MHTPCPSIGLFKSFRAKPSSTALKSLTRQDGVEEQSPNGYSFVPNDICASCSSCTQNQYLQDGIGVLDWLLRGGQNFMFHLSIGRGRKNSKNNTCLLGVCIRCLRMRDLSLSCLLILTSIPFLGAFFCVG
jgi:hypothetical protein